MRIAALETQRPHARPTALTDLAWTPASGPRTLYVYVAAVGNPPRKVPSRRPVPLSLGGAR